MLRLASLRSTKWLVPMSRCALIRPATRKLAPSANFSRMCAISPEVSKAAPKGATPSFSKAANFSRRNASNSLSVCSMPASDSKQNQPNEQIEWGQREHSAGRLGFQTDRHLLGQIRLEMEEGR